MRDIAPIQLELGRITNGDYGTRSSDGMLGAFFVRNKGILLKIISSGIDKVYGWEHVSVSIKRQNRTPTWEEMCFVKDLFWTEDECVIQYHPPKSEYVNYHPNCLHLWKPVGVNIMTPPSLLVGPKE